MVNDVRPFFYNYLHLTSGHILIHGIISFATLFLVVRVLQPEGYGVYVLFGSVASIIAVLFQWTSVSIVRFGREEFITEGSIKKTFWANYSVLLPALALCFLPIFIFRAQLTQYIGIPMSYYYLIFAFILISNLSNTIPVVFQAVGKMRHLAYLPQISGGVFLVALVAIYLKSIPVPVELLIGILIATHLCIVVPGLWLLRKAISPPSFSGEWLKRCLSYSYPLAFGSVGGALVKHVDQIIIGIFMPVAFVGIYNVAYRMQDYIFGLPSLSRRLMFPLMTSLVVTGKEAEIDRYIRNYVPQIAFFWSLILSLFMIFGRELLSIFGSTYVAGFLPFSILLLAASLQIFSIIESPILNSYGLTKAIAGMAVATMVINLGLDYLLIPRIGISGAAIATGISLILNVIMRSLVVKKWTGINDFPNYPWAFPAVIGFAAVFIESVSLRVLLLLAIVIGSLAVAKKSAIFSSDSLTILESIEMPVYIRKVVRRVYSLLT